MNLPQQPAVLTWSTDEFRPHERFDYWREERGRQLFGVTMELPPERRHQFHGRFSATRSAAPSSPR